MKDIPVTDAQLYTLRWHLMEIARKSNDEKIDGLAIDAMHIASQMLGEPMPKEFSQPVPDRPDPGTQPQIPVTGYNQKLLWYPGAIKGRVKLAASGLYPKGYPEGLVVHFLSGRYEKGLESAHDAISYARSEGYNFFALATTGEIVQAAPLSQWGSHAGTSAWSINGKKVSGVSGRFAGIELCNGSRLTKKGSKYFTWFGYEVPASDVRYAERMNDNIQPGYYHKYTVAQEKKLIEFCLWLKLNNPDVFSFDNVVGHDECAGPKGIGYSRKQDPGFALSMTMTEFRDLLKTEYSKLTKKTT